MSLRRGVKVRRGANAVVIVGIALALTATTVWAAPRSDVKPYLLANASPASVRVGSTATFSVDITNQSAQQQIGSANIRVPELRVTSANATPDGTSATFLNLALAPGASTTLTFTAMASCSPGTYAWVVTVKQSNDFNGPPGNDFAPAPGSATPTTDITGSCRLAFENQPADTSGPGTVALQDATTTEWVWVLPDCGPQVPSDAACVLSRNKDNAGRVLVVFRLAPGDPTWW
jgi:hypothetical protein